MRRPDNYFAQAMPEARPIVLSTVLVRTYRTIRGVLSGRVLPAGRALVAAVCLLGIGATVLGEGEESIEIAGADNQAVEAVTTPDETRTAEAVLTGSSMVLPPGFSRVQLMDLLEVIGRQVQSGRGYKQIQLDPEGNLLSDAAAEFDLVGNYELKTPQERRYLQIGVQILQTRAGMLVVQGYQIAEGKSGPNPDVEAVVGMVKASVEDLTSQTKEMLARDLPKIVYQLNYVEASKALEALKIMGYTVIESASFQANKPIDQKTLPFVSQMPGPTTTSLEKIQTVAGAKGIRLPGEAEQQFSGSTTGGPMERLLITYSPALGERQQLVKLLELLQKKIDIAAPQMLIEGMVLEVSETGIKQLGVEYELGRFDSAGTNPRYSAAFQTATGQSQRPVILSFDSSIIDNLDRYRVILRALIREGHAQVLARPSVLALNNRQARIRVTTEVPISSTAVTELTTEVKVEYVSVGIVLNLRPRMNYGGEEISFQIDASVSDIDQTSPYRIQLDPDSLIGAQAPVITTRQVQTFARVRNNTPLIIGGLIARRTLAETDRVPFLSDIPILGWLFRNQDNSTERREVIIVLTPYVLPEGTEISRATPKDSDMFDEIDPIDPMLFRAIYRIRVQDVFDLTFLRNNEELNELTAEAKEILLDRPWLAKKAPFDDIAVDRVPGEAVLVERMVYQIIKKLGLGKKVTSSNLILFKRAEEQPEGFDVRFLTEELTGRRDGDLAGYFEEHPNRAVAMTFEVKEGRPAREVIRESVPEIRLLELTGRDQWRKLLYEMNQPVNGVQRWTILINNQSDVDRLRAALILKRTIDLNRSDDGFYLKNFRVGRQLTFPVISEDRTYLIDWEIAKYFYHTEHYYAAFQDKLHEGLNTLREYISQYRSEGGPLKVPEGFEVPAGSKI